MISKLSFLVLLAAVFCNSLTAQINESDSLKLKAKLSVTGILQGGNVQTEVLRSKAEVSYRPIKEIAFKTTNSYIYQEFGNVKADEDFLSLNFLYFNPERDIYPLALGFISSNFRREINLRSLFGLGLTFQIFNKNDNWLKCSVSSEYEQTEFKKDRFNIEKYNGNESINTFRGTLWLNGKYNLLKKKAILTHESYFQPSLEEADNYRWSADIGLEFPIWKFLNFKVNYLHTFESLGVDSQQEEDQTLTFGFTLKNFWVVLFTGQVSSENAHHNLLPLPIDITLQARR